MRTLVGLPRTQQVAQHHQIVMVAEHVLRCLLAEADLTMGLNGYASIADLTPSALVSI